MFYGIAINVISMSKEDHLCMHIRNGFMRVFNFLVIIARGKLRKHIRRVHEGLQFPCDEFQCDYKTGTKESLRHHLKSKHENVRFNCQECEYIANKEALLKRHVNSCHRKVRYYCDKCTYQTSVKSNLTEHMSKDHGGEEYVCLN